jgi:hypothetical protein
MATTAAGTRVHPGRACQTQKRETSARCVYPTVLFEQNQGVGGLCGAVAGEATEARGIDEQRVAAEAEQRVQDAICSVSRHITSVSWD